MTRPPLPRNLQIEVTGACNLRCRMCLVRYRPALGPAASMSFETFRRLMDELPDVRSVTLQGLGEPLMAPDIFQMIEYCRVRRVNCGFNSNATLLTARTSLRLIEAGLDWLHISIDGASKETYEFVRDQSRWEIVERNVSGLVSLMRQLDVERPALSIVMVLMRNNFRDLPAVVRRAAEWGIPRVRAQNLSHDFSDAPPETYRSIAEFVQDQSVVHQPPEEIGPVLQEALAEAQRFGISLRLPRMEERPPQGQVNGMNVGCDWPWRSAYVNWDSGVQPCCMVMGSDRVRLGSLQDASFADIWESEDYARFREGLMNGNPHPVCRGCSAYRGTF